MTAPDLIRRFSDLLHAGHVRGEPDFMSTDDAARLAGELTGRGWQAWAEMARDAPGLVDTLNHHARVASGRMQTNRVRCIVRVTLDHGLLS